MSTGRPIHTLSRGLRNTPDEAEPSYSYEDQAFLNSLEDDVEDEFHRRLAGNARRDGSAHGAGNTSGGTGSFWRTDLSSRGGLSKVPVTVKERKASGGLLGAALQLHAQSSSIPDSGEKGNSSTITRSLSSQQRNARGSDSTALRLHSSKLLNSNSGHSHDRRKGSTGSQGSAGINIGVGEVASSSILGRDSKKNISKQRAAERRLKMDSLINDVDIGHAEMDPPDIGRHSSLGRRNSGDSTSRASNGCDHHEEGDSIVHDREALESLASHDYIIETSGSSRSGSSIIFPGKASHPRSSGGVLFGKSSSLLSPSGIDAHGSNGAGIDSSNLTKHKISLLLDQCETVRYPFKKKLIMSSMNLTAIDIPIKELNNTNLGKTLHKLSLSGNRLSTIPPKLAVCLPTLKTMDLSQCELHQLPERWNLPQLKRLNLSHNRLTDFPEEAMLEGLPELLELNMYGNKVSVIVVPQNPKLLRKLETLNLGYNDLAEIPDELDHLKSLKILKVMNNFLERIPMRVCDMDLKMIDVSSNPVIQPPIETCERGISSMKRYYHCLRMEEQSKQKALDALQSKVARSKGKEKKKKKLFNLSKPNRIRQISLGSKASDDSSSIANTSQLDSRSGHSVHSEDSRASLPRPARRSASIGHGVSDSTPARHSENNRTLIHRSARRSSSMGLGVTDLAPPRQFEDSITPVNSPARRSSSMGLGLSDTSPARRSSSMGLGLSDSAHSDQSRAPTKSRGAAFSLDTREELRRAQSLDEREKSTPNRGKRQTSTSSTLSEVEVNTATSEDLKDLKHEIDDVTVNDTLKVIFVGMALAGKTSMIKRLIDGEDAVVPKRDERTVGVDIYEWDPKDDHRFEHIDSRIELQDKELEEKCGDVNVKFSVWDFAGQHVYHATHELFFSPRAMYVLVWDMGTSNPATNPRKTDSEIRRDPFSLSYESDSDSDGEDDFQMEEENIRAERALKRDIDDKIQFWIDCIQSSAPGAAILPVATFDDKFAENPQEARRRCRILKERLLDHEVRRIQGIKDRLKKYVDQNRANDEGALRLRKLLCSYNRPKLIFGDTDDDAVIRVSGTKYTGFAKLTKRIINIAAGREKASMKYPIFRGHIGARIPRMRLKVKETVRRMRDKFKVVEWGYFTKQLRENHGITSIGDISDALHFLTNIGELSYFGGIMNDRRQMIASMDDWAKDSTRASMSLMGSGDDVSVMSEEDIDMDDERDDTVLSVDNTSMTMSSTEGGSVSTLGDALNGGLSQFVFLNPRWLVASVACILRHDLEREIQETKRALRGHKPAVEEDSLYEGNMNCPLITADDACMLWQAKKFTKKAAERLIDYSENMPVKPFEFLQLLLVRFGVFVPIDLGIDKACLGGKEYARPLPDNEDDKPKEITLSGSESNTILKAAFFFLPSLLGPGEPAEAWTYKSTDSWKATLCHSVLFPDGVPPGLMERINASVLSNIYAIGNRQEKQTIRSVDGSNVDTYEGHLTVKEVLCWRTAFFVKVGMRADNENKESIVEVFCGLVDKESHLCVGSDYMLSGMRRLVTSGKGQAGDGGRKIWKGGYLIVLKAVQKVMDEYGGLEFEKQGFCPDCLRKKGVAEATFWDFTVVRAAVKNGESIMRCRYGHRIDTRLVAGPLDNLPERPNVGLDGATEEPVVPIHDILRGVVVVGLWDGKSRTIKRVGSGFIADKRRGLIVTASHTLMNIWGDKSTPFGENYYGLRQGKVVIGVIPRKKIEETGTEAVFRYFAKIVAKDPFIDQGVCQLDACVLKITTRMESDVSGNGEGCADQPERLLVNNPLAFKQEKLHALKITDKCELDEQVRIVGYNQGGEGLLGPGVSLNRYVDFARGYVCKKFAGGGGTGAAEGQERHKFRPREEIVVICPTIGGHSGGPCVNQNGEVIGILSRADPAESQRCYLVPTYEWRGLLREAKSAL